MTERPNAAWVILLAAETILGGCAGAQTRFYTLDPAPSGTPTAASIYAGPPLRVDAVHIPPALDRMELVRQAAGNRLVVSDNDHWAAPLAEMIRRVLTQDLTARLPGGTVIFPDAPKPHGATGVVIDVLALSQGGGEITMDASWTLIPTPLAGGPAKAPPVVRQRAVRLSTPNAGAGVRGDAAELSALVSQLADRIAADLDTAPTP